MNRQRHAMLSRGISHTTTPPPPVFSDINIYINPPRLPSHPFSLCRPLSQRCSGLLDDLGRLFNRDVRQRPVAALDDVPDGREEGLVVAGPELWAKNDVAELCAVGNLFSHAVSVCKGEENWKRATYTAIPRQIQEMSIEVRHRIIILGSLIPKPNRFPTVRG